jgi:hypothetical protein
VLLEAPSLILYLGPGGLAVVGGAAVAFFRWREHRRALHDQEAVEADARRQASDRDPSTGEDSPRRG